MLLKGTILANRALNSPGFWATGQRYLSTSPLFCQQAKVAPLEPSDSKFSEDVAPKHFSKIPGPSKLPIVKSLFSMMLDKDFDRTQIHLYWMKLIRVHGPMVRMEMPNFPPIVILTDPDECEKVARATMDNPLREGFYALAKIRKEAVDNYFEKKGGLLTENNEEWKRVRTKVQTPMMKAKNVTSYLDKMDQVSHEFMDRIADFQKQYSEMPETFVTELYKWALESVSLVALNRRLGCLDPSLPEDSEQMRLIHSANVMLEAMNDTEISAQLWRIFPTPSYNRLEKSHTEMLRVADKNVEETEALLRSKKDSGEDLTLMETLLLTPGLTKKDVVTLILDMLFAGIDTTSHTVGFTLYLLARNPECQKRLQEEIDMVLQDHTGPLSSKHLAQLSYLKAVVKESLRLFPLAIGSVRTLEKDVVLGGYLVTKGHAVVSFVMAMAQDERYFPRAKEFLPERWLRHKPLGPIHPYASLPFGSGTRMCIGRRIAEQEIYTFLTRAMQRYTVDYKYEDMKIVTRMLLAPAVPLRFSFKERNKGRL